jgi:uncharacterized repeat protein (TIGR04076 family)
MKLRRYFGSNSRTNSKEPIVTKFFEIYDLRVTVDAINGQSVCGMQVGDYFEVIESSKLRIPEGKHFCIYALNAVLPLLPAKQRQLDENDWLERDVLVACPDPEEGLIMRIERIARRTMDSENLT